MMSHQNTLFEFNLINRRTIDVGFIEE